MSSPNGANFISHSSSSEYAYSASQSSTNAPPSSSLVQTVQSAYAAAYPPLPYGARTKPTVTHESKKDSSKGHNHTHKTKPYRIHLLQCSINGLECTCLPLPKIPEEKPGRIWNQLISPTTRRAMLIEKEYLRLRDPLIGYKKFSPAGSWHGGPMKT